jgi:hypothetical protein
MKNKWILFFKENFVARKSVKVLIIIKLIRLGECLHSRISKFNFDLFLLENFILIITFCSVCVSCPEGPECIHNLKIVM